MAEYSICKCIRTDKPVKKNGKYPIYIRVRVRDKGCKITTNLEVRADRWDDKNKEPKDKPLLIQLNKKILDLDLHINRMLADGHELTLELVKDFYCSKKKIRPEQESFYTYYLDFVERKRKEGLNPETIRVYMTTYNVLKEFREEIAICDLTLNFIESFDNYMKDVNGNSPGGRNPKHKNLRTVILDMEKHGVQIKNPYKFFKVPSSDVKEIYLDKGELSSFIEYYKQFPTNSKEYRIMRMYEFSCYTGLRFSDVVDLRWEHIDFENGLVRKIMVKTKSEVIIPLFPLAKEILTTLESYTEPTDKTKKVFYHYFEPTVNQTLRKHSKLAGINKHITYHSSRHTFATLLVVDGVDIYKIQKYLGHASVNMTQRYLKYDLSIAKQSAKGIHTFSGQSS